MHYTKQRHARLGVEFHPSPEDVYQVRVFGRWLTVKGPDERFTRLPVRTCTTYEARSLSGSVARIPEPQPYLTDDI